MADNFEKHLCREEYKPIYYSKGKQAVNNWLVPLYFLSQRCIETNLKVVTKKSQPVHRNSTRCTGWLSMVYTLIDYPVHSGNKESYPLN